MGDVGMESGAAFSAADAPDVYARIVGALSAGIVAVTPEGRVIAVNDAAREHLNLPESKLSFGSVFTSLPGMEPFAAMIEEVCQSRQPMARGEVTLGQTAVTKKEIGVSVSPLEGPSGVEGAILLFNNMTERRQQERNDALNRQLVALGELAAGVVHQVRNPLTIITGRSELLLRQVQDDLHSEYLESIIGEANQIALSLSTFLQCAKPFEFKPRQCEAQSIVDRAVQVCRPRADEKEVDVSVESAEGLEVMHVDPERLAEALSNLLENAIEATPVRGCVSVAARQDGPMTVFSVVDEGLGVHVGEHDDIYSPFFTQKRDGTGLGLSIAQRIATLQGGAARHHNVADGGACFEIEVPTFHGRGE